MGVRGGGGMTHKPSWTLCEQLVWSLSLFFYSWVLVTWYFRIVVWTCFYPHSLVKNKPPRTVSAENFGTFMPTCCFSAIFINLYIYIYIYIYILHTHTQSHILILWTLWLWPGKQPPISFHDTLPYDDVSQHSLITKGSAVQKIPDWNKTLIEILNVGCDPVPDLKHSNPVFFTGHFGLWYSTMKLC